MNDQNPQVPTPPPPPEQGPMSGQYYPSNSPYPMAPPNESKAVVALVLGILGLTTCAGLTSPFAWVMGANSRKRIKESGGQLGGDGLALAGMICGIVGSVLLILYVLYFAFFIVIVVLTGDFS